MEKSVKECGNMGKNWGKKRGSGKMRKNAEKCGNMRTQSIDQSLQTNKQKIEKRKSINRSIPRNNQTKNRKTKID